MPIEQQRMIADLVLRRRGEAGLSQQAVVDHLSRFDVDISRSHFSNLESGKYAFAPKALAVLSGLLSLSEIGLPEWPGSGNESNVFDLGDSLDEWLRIGVLTPDLAARGPANKKVLREAPYLEERILHGEAAVAGHICELLLSKTPSFDGDMITVVGGSEFLVNQFERMRSAFVGAMRDGWILSHTLEVDSSPRSIRFSASMLGCRRYRGFVGPVSAETLLLVIGGISPMVIEYSVARESAVILVGEDYCEHFLAQASRSPRRAIADPLLSDTRDRGSATWSLSELSKTDLLTSHAKNGTYQYYSLGWIPSSIVPPQVLAENIRLRGSINGYSERARELVLQHEYRFEWFRRKLEKHPVRVLIPKKSIEEFVTSGTFRPGGDSIPRWRRYSVQQRIEVLNHLLTLTEERQNFELIIIDAVEYDDTVARYAFAVRGGLDGHVLVRTPAQDARKDSNLDVDLFIAIPEAITAYSLVFERSVTRFKSNTIANTSEYLKACLLSLSPQSGAFITSRY